jgi:3-isopropylmalate dehydrogenase
MSIAIMLDHLGMTQAARDVEAAVAQYLATRGSTQRSTTEVGDALLALL